MYVSSSSCGTPLRPRTSLILDPTPTPTLIGITLSHDGRSTTWSHDGDGARPLRWLSVLVFSRSGKWRWRWGKLRRPTGRRWWEKLEATSGKWKKSTDNWYETFEEKNCFEGELSKQKCHHVGVVFLFVTHSKDGKPSFLTLTIQTKWPRAKKEPVILVWAQHSFPRRRLVLCRKTFRVMGIRETFPCLFIRLGWELVDLPGSTSVLIRLMILRWVAQFLVKEWFFHFVSGACFSHVHKFRRNGRGVYCAWLRPWEWTEELANLAFVSGVIQKNLGIIRDELGAVQTEPNAVTYLLTVEQIFCLYFQGNGEGSAIEAVCWQRNFEQNFWEYCSFPASVRRNRHDWSWDHWGIGNATRAAGANKRQSNQCSFWEEIPD